MKYIKSFILFEEDGHFDDGLGTKFWGKVGSGLLPFSKKTKRFLIQLRAHWVDEPNTWGNWGGAVKKENPTEEDILDSAITEFKEESEFNGKINKVILLHIFKSGTFKYYNYVAEIADEFIPIKTIEYKEYKWITFEELINQTDLHSKFKMFLNESYKKLKEISF